MNEQHGRQPLLKNKKELLAEKILVLQKHVEKLKQEPVSQIKERVIEELERELNEQFSLYNSTLD
jgi:hypothetical protein